MVKISPKQFSLFLMLALVVLATTLRIILISHNWPGTNSDEATMDLMAFHSAYHGELPIFFYGQGYMGSIQAYVGALLFHIFGVSIFSVRLGLILMYALFLVGMYYLTSFLYTRSFALIVVGLLAFGSSDLLTVQVFANGGYAETRVFGVFIALMAFWLAYSSRPSVQQRQQPISLWRTMLYMVLGLCTGLAIWSDMIILPCVLTSGLLLWLYCRREIVSRSGLFLLAGFLVGFLPMILYNVSAPVNYDSFHALAGATQYTASRNGVTLLQQILQTLVITLPRATGVYPACYMLEPMHYASSIGDLYVGSRTNPTQCFVIEGSWGLGATILWSIAFIVTILPLRHYWQRVKKFRQEAIPDEKSLEHASLSQEERRFSLLQSARSALLVSAALSLLLYMLSFSAAANPRSTSRYLVCLFFALPVVLWPLWHGVSRSIRTNTHIDERPLPARFVGIFIRFGILLSIFIVFLVGTLNIWSEIPMRQAAYNAQAQLTQDILHLGVTHIYSDYWTCARLTFQSQEHLICAALDEKLQPGQDRYTPYRDIVHADPHASYAFQTSSPEAKILPQMLSRSRFRYQRYLFENYVVYVFSSPK